ncbi:MAG: hypothetical protein ACREP2_08745, partial [Rhodanobacteraceae bacterium]
MVAVYSPIVRPAWKDVFMVTFERLARFEYHQTMDVGGSDAPICDVAAAIAEPARARMLCRLLDGHARTGTELAIVAGVSPS